MENYGCVTKYKQLIMSQLNKKIKKFDQSVDKLFNLLNKIDLESLSNLKHLEKEAKQLQKEIEENTKSLDSKK